MRNLLLSASLLSLGSGLAGAAHAQAAQPPAATPDGSGDIIVTAQRRSESLQKVPITIAAITPKQLETYNIKSINQIELLTPGLIFNNYVGYSQAYIRGIGQQAPNPGLETPVAFYIDGVYVSRGQGALYDVLDADSLQVLKGPQGTLYGRNATGGAVLINTADPTSKPSLKMTAEYGRFNHALLEAVANEPVTQNVAIRVAARINRSDGFVDDLTTGNHLGGRTSYTIRGKVKWTITPELTNVISVQYDHTKERLVGFATRVGAPECLACVLDPSVGPVEGFYDVENDVDAPFISHNTGAYMKTSYDGDMIHVDNTLGYRSLGFATTSDQDYSPLPLLNFFGYSGGKSYSEDVQAYSKGTGWLNGMIGGSYLHDRGYFGDELTGALFAPVAAAVGEYPAVYNSVLTHSYSIFGEVYLTPVEHLKITLGARYTHDKRNLSVINNVGALAALAPSGTPLTFGQKASFHGTTPRAVIAYDLGTTNIYASYNRGFKAGGFNTPLAGFQNVIKPEKIDGFEAGVKYVSPDRRIRFNLAGFYYKYSNIQVGVTDLQSGGQRIENAASGKGYGFDTDLALTPAEWLRLGAGLSYLHTRYDSYANASVVRPATPADAAADPTGQTFPGELINSTEDLAGFPFARSPKWSGYGSASLLQDFGDYKAHLDGVVRFSSRYLFTPGAGGPLRLDVQPAYALVNLSGGIGPSGGRYEIGFYLDNLTGTKYFGARQTVAPFAAYDSAAAPRTYGVRVTANF